jgi:L-ribulokinase
MSPEMEMPKLMWLKTEAAAAMGEDRLFLRSRRFHDLAGNRLAARSRCTLTAKWNYLAHKENGWQEDFLKRSGLRICSERGGLPDETLPVGRSRSGI